MICWNLIYINYNFIQGKKYPFYTKQCSSTFRTNKKCIFVSGLFGTYLNSNSYRDYIQSPDIMISLLLNLNYILVSSHKHVALTNQMTRRHHLLATTNCIPASHVLSNLPTYKRWPWPFKDWRLIYMYQDLVTIFMQNYLL